MSKKKHKHVAFDGPILRCLVGDYNRNGIFTEHAIWATGSEHINSPIIDYKNLIDDIDDNVFIA